MNTFLRKHHALIITLLTTAIIYATTLTYGFFFDDLHRISQNFSLTTANPLASLFTHTRWVTEFLNHLIYRFSGLNPFGYRIVNLLLHLFNGTLVYLLTTVLTRKSRWYLATKHSSYISLLATILFLLHPLQSQTVCYIVQMQLEGLVVACTLGVTLLVHFALTTTATWKRWTLIASALAVTAIASGIKEIILMLPVLVLLTQVMFPSIKSWHRFVLVGAVAASLFVPYSRYPQPIDFKQATTLQTSVDNARGNVITGDKRTKIHAIEYMMTQPGVILHYLTKAVWPAGLCYDYDMRLAESLWSVEVLLPGLILLLLALLALWWFVRGFDLLFFGAAWYALTLLPRASIIPTPELICDYKTYFPNVGLFIGFAALIACIVH